ncbi:MAG: serine/threonine protein kinase [Gemmataceae bacterium]|nr:serine/threonine protein kinase [Gemmataceae bacterium]
MHRYCRSVFILLVAGLASTVFAADWRQFRGPTGQGISNEKDLPIKWSSEENIAWKAKLPGAGASCPITLGKRIYITCYSGYGMDTKQPGQQANLKRHLLCMDRADGKVVWAKEFQPVLPEHNYNGEGAYHGYAASTPITDGERLYVFFGKSGVYCFDLDGNELWRAPVGKNTSGWGSGTSPMFYKNLVIVNASVEAGALVAFDKMSGKEVWRSPGIGSAWNTPLLVTTPEKEQELVVSVNGRVIGINPDTGKELWRADGVKSYVCSSVVAHEGTVYATGGGNLTLAVKTGGRGDVSKSNILWQAKKGSNASSPLLHNGYLYWASESGGVLHCQDAKTGEFAYSERLKPDAGRIWASPVYADGNLYYVSQFKGVFVIAAGPKFALVAQNVFKDDASRSNASIAISDGQLLLRNDQYLYCVGKK